MLNRRERVVIGVGVAGLLAIGAYLYVIEPMLARQREVAELIPIREATLERRRLMIAQRGQLSAELEALGRKVEAASSGLLSGPTAPLAASELQKLVKELAAAADVDVRSERVMAPVDLTGVLEIPIELTVACTTRQAVALLSRLEQTPRLLRVKDLKIRVAAPGQPRELLATLTVAGYLRSAPVPKAVERPTQGDAT
ncbi:MAG TPA: type II secretion system protein GspM [Candidatus Bathyarchaeia archaeon]|nr:type II secretion system protein GspM [Candidatus Bathyarchaeia archaeon]